MKTNFLNQALNFLPLDYIILVQVFIDVFKVKTKTTIDSIILTNIFTQE